LSDDSKRRGARCCPGTRRP